jgi:tetratricopeptide (TPR) repeat protein/transcriptional regulator with XRE-family HTH domain
MRARRAPNQSLRELLGEAGWTGQALASAVNDLGVETGLRLHYDRTTVAHWLSGSRPRPPVPELVAEALSRKLRRRIPVSATGLAPPADDDLASWWGQAAVERLVRLAGEGPGSPGAVYSLAALSVPTFSALVAHRSASGVESSATAVGPQEVSSATAMLDMFAVVDVAFGGGRAHPALSAYLRSTVAPWLQANTSPTVHRDLLVAAARLSYLCGFTCFDEELHGVAQRYYLTGLRLAAEAGDSTDYAILLCGLSAQAHHLGHRQQARDLAQSAVRTAGTRAPAQTRAFLLGQLAVTTAAGGDQHAAVVHLRAAESLLEQADGTNTAIAVYHQATLYHQHAEVWAHGGDRRAAIEALSQSLRHRPADERRARAITLAWLGELQLADGHLEQACDTWQQFLDDYPRLSSARVNTALATLRSRIRPFSNHPIAHALNQRAATMNTPVSPPAQPGSR